MSEVARLPDEVVERLLADRRRREIDGRLLAGYARHPAPPATPADHALVDALIDEEPW